MNNQPIGIMDSGVGGLTVMGEIARELPHESIAYIGDSQHAPYGRLMVEEIYLHAREMIVFLLTKNVKLIVIACNTITVNCIDRLRMEFTDVPIIGAVPVVKTAAEVTKNKKIGILSTTSTARSQSQKDLISNFAHDCKVLVVGTDELVPLVERGELKGKQVETVLPRVLQPFKAQEIDALALGCTHFPFLRERIQAFLGKNVAVLDSGAAIARHVRRILEHNRTLTSKRKARYEFYSTGDVKIAKKLIDSTIYISKIKYQRAKI